jgi:hypothetical protein
LLREIEPLALVAALNDKQRRHNALSLRVDEKTASLQPVALRASGANRGDQDRPSCPTAIGDCPRRPKPILILRNCGKSW